MTALRVRGGLVVTPSGVVARDVWAADAVLVAEPVGDAATLDVDGCWVGPGFVDAQINGSDGIDLTTEPHRLGELAARLPRDGVTSFAPTIVTCPADVRDRALATPLTAVRRAARPVGFHLEGPLLSPARRGAHRGEHLRLPADVDVRGWRRDGGVAVATVAPELPGAIDVIRALAAAGVVVSLGHTDAAVEPFRAGIAAGARLVTHLYNAMRPFSHRDPGPVGATLADEGVVAGLIVDGIHVDPVAVVMAWRALGPQRTMLVTDAVAARGTDSGDLGAARVTRDASGVRLADGTLAGSDLRMDAAVRNLLAFTGCSVPEALTAASTTPAAALGLTDCGRIEPGRRADLVVLDDQLRIVATIVAGEVAWRS